MMHDCFERVEQCCISEVVRICTENGSSLTPWLVVAVHTQQQQHLQTQQNLTNTE